ncbi:MAG: hypothetical protein AB7T01_03850 [Acidithiobacillus sp.]
MLNHLQAGERSEGAGEAGSRNNDALPLFIFGVEQTLRRVRTRAGYTVALEPWPELAHAERIVQHQLLQLPENWTRERQNLADRLCRLLLLRFAHTRIFADTSALEQCPAILLALSRVWWGEGMAVRGQDAETLLLG